jgi:mRNA interferase MazF
VRLPDGLEVGGVVLSDQIKSLDWRARKATLIDRAPAAVIDPGGDFQNSPFAGSRQQMPL